MFELKLHQRKRQILHIDADAFFASVEQILNPKLKGKPVLVGGPTDTHGIVSAASYEARKYGVKSAMPMYLAKRKCPHAVVVHGNFRAYRSFSRRMYEVFAKYTPDIEMMSIDEAYLDITGVSGESAEVARTILMNVYKDLGLSVSCGLASNKTVAKVASSLNKPHKLTIVPPGRERSFLAPLHLRKLPGVGPSTYAVLQKYGFEIINDVARLSFPEVMEKFGLRGIPLWKKCRGIDDSSVKGEVSLPKSISKEHTFYVSSKNSEQCLKTLKDLSVKVFSKLRGYDLKARTVYVKIRYKNYSSEGKYGFRDVSVQKNLGTLSSTDRELFPLVKDLFMENYSEGESVRLVGLGVSGLVQNYNLSLFEDSSRNDRLFRAVDGVRELYGRDTLNYGV